MKQISLDNLDLFKKIDEALKTIKCDKLGNWYVPNRESLGMTILEFAEFERARLLEFENEKIRETKYKWHYAGEKNDENNNNK